MMLSYQPFSSQQKSLITPLVFRLPFVSWSIEGSICSPVIEKSLIETESAHENSISDKFLRL